MDLRDFVIYAIAVIAFLVSLAVELVTGHSSVVGVVVAAPLLFVIPPIFMRVRRGTGSNALAGVAALGGAMIYAVPVIWLMSRLFGR